MNVDIGTVIQLAAIVASGLIGWFTKMLFDRMKQIEEDNHKQSVALADLRALIPERYVSKDDQKTTLDNIFSMLRRIEDKLDGKADK